MLMQVVLLNSGPSNPTVIWKNFLLLSFVLTQNGKTATNRKPWVVNLVKITLLSSRESR